MQFAVGASGARAQCALPRVDGSTSTNYLPSENTKKKKKTEKKNKITEIRSRSAGHQLIKLIIISRSDDKPSNRRCTVRRYDTRTPMDDVSTCSSY